MVPQQRGRSKKVYAALVTAMEVYLNAGIAYAINRADGVAHNVAYPSALIGASNFFELAVAAAIALFGFHSGAATRRLCGVVPLQQPALLPRHRRILGLCPTGLSRPRRRMRGTRRADRGGKGGRVTQAHQPAVSGERRQPRPSERPLVIDNQDADTPALLPEP